MESGARYLATGKRKSSIARVTLLPGSGKIEVNERALEEFFPRPLHQTMARQPLDDHRLRGQRRRPRPRPRRRHQRPGWRGSPRHLPRPDRDRSRAARRAEAPRLPDSRRAGEGAPQGRPQEGSQAPAVQQALGAVPVAKGRKLFGTDGVRGEAGTFLTAELATTLGRAAAASLAAERPQVLIVRDTRESGPMLEAALAAGIAAAGGDALLGGVLPTPAAAILARRSGSTSRSSSPPPTTPTATTGSSSSRRPGTKLDDEAEARIEALIEAEAAAAEPGRVRELNGGLEDYLRALEAAFPLDLSGCRVLLDCANGATFRAASGDLRAARRRRSRRSPPSPTAATSTTAAARPTSTTWPPGSPHPRRRSASPSTATATASSPSTAPAAPTTATS